MPLRFCSALKEGGEEGELKKLNRDKFCGPAGFLRYCPSEMKTASSENHPKESILPSLQITEVEIENQANPKTKTSAEFVEGESQPPKKEDECEEGETCMPLRFCSLEGKLSGGKLCENSISTAADWSLL